MHLIHYVRSCLLIRLVVSLRMRIDIMSATQVAPSYLFWMKLREIICFYAIWHLLKYDISTKAHRTYHSLMLESLCGSWKVDRRYAIVVYMYWTYLEQLRHGLCMQPSFCPSCSTLLPSPAFRSENEINYIYHFRCICTWMHMLLLMQLLISFTCNLLASNMTR